MTTTTPAKKRGRPEKLTIQKFAANPPATLPKTDNQRIKELKEIIIRSSGKDVVEKVVQIALTDGHPGQMAAIKMCMDRALPISLFEKASSQRNAVTINITGLGGEPITIGQNQEPDVIDMEQPNGQE
ncbi:MAG: hypothetical protein EBU08_05800 [Micrococcales bacterium]|nr:hypothetical protein [Micrococcales bacterium]